MTNRMINDQVMNIFVGIVESLDDPEKLGRVSIRVINDNDADDLSTEQLRLAYVMMPTTSASLAGVGQSPTGIQVGSYAFGFYLDQKEKNIPILIGTYHKIPEKDPEKHDSSKLSREINNIEKDPIGPEPQSAYNAKYPHNKTITTTSGHVIEIDDTPDNERLHVYHSSGSYIEINKDGRTVRKVVDDDIEVVIKDKKVYVEGNVQIVVKGNATIDVKGNMSSRVRGNSQIKTSGNIEVNSGGSSTFRSDGPVDIQSSSSITLNAPTVNLNPPGGSSGSFSQDSFPYQ